MPYFGYRPPQPLILCGCWYILHKDPYQKKYLPQVELDSKTKILSCTARTKLVQTFTNIESTAIPEAQYTFPLYDGVSVVSFTCTVGDRTIHGIVKEKQQARADYQEAVDRGQTASLLEQFQEAGDVFTTKIGNIPAAGKVTIEIEYLGELKHDAEHDGIRFTIPSAIAPRYGSVSGDSQQSMFGLNTVYKTNGMKVLVDVVVEEGSAIRGLQSPSHPIAVTLGRTSTHDEDVFENNLASATLTVDRKTELDQDFVIVVNAKGQDTPRALLETHDALPNQRALMTTLVPKFNLPNASPEIVFVVDRSGSMQGKISLVVQALRIFLKSLPTSVKFNICSFGTRHDFLFKKSKPYDESSLKEALKHLESFDANYGGTEMLLPIKQCVKQRLSGASLEIMVLTDGEIWNQDELFQFVNDAAKDKVRLFSLGIGDGASTSLVEGMARVGNGFAQFVYDGEKMDKRVVRMLKAALMPFVSDYTLEVVYESEDADDSDGFTIVESFTESLKGVVEGIETENKTQKSKKSISLFNVNFKEDKPSNQSKGRYDHLPSIDVPKVLQAPYKIPQLYPFTRTTIYLLFGPGACQKQPRKVILRGTTEHGPLELEIAVQDVGKGRTVHQLAAKKAAQDLEEGRGWLSEATLSKGKLMQKAFESDWERIVEREAVRLGTKFGVAGKFCSFVAVDANEDSDIFESPISNEEAEFRQDSRRVSRKKMAVFGNGLQTEKKKKSAPSGFGGAAPGSTVGARGGGLFGSAISSFGGAQRPAPPPPPPMPAGAAPKPMAFGQQHMMRASNAPAAYTQQQFMMQQSQSFGSAVPPSPSFSRAPPPPAAARLRSVDARLDTTRRADKAAVAKEFTRAELDNSSASYFVHSAADEDMFDEEAEAATSAPTVKPTASSTMLAIIDLQEFNGSWKNSAQLLVLTGISAEAFDKALPPSASCSDGVRATVLAIAWLEAKASSERETWEMVVDKARDWLSAQGIADAGALVFSAEKVLVP